MKLNTERKQLKRKYFTIRKEEENPTIRRGIRVYVENIKEVRDGRQRFQELIPSFRKLCFELFLCRCHCSSPLLGCPVLGRKLDMSGDLRPLRVMREIWGTAELVSKLWRSFSDLLERGDDGDAD